MSGEQHKIQFRLEPHPDGPAATNSMNAAALAKAREEVVAQAKALGIVIRDQGEIDPTQPVDHDRVRRIKAVADPNMAPKPDPRSDESRLQLIAGVRRGGCIDEFDEVG